MRVFLLEDDDIFGPTLEDFLDENGFDVVLGSDGEQALELAYEHKFDILLLDINVPHLNGIEVLKKIREKNSNIPAIFLTSFKDTEVINQAFRAGCDDYLRKPFSLDELLLRINAVMQRCGYFDHMYDFGNGFLFDMKNKVLFQDGKIFVMSQKTLELLNLLLLNINKLVSKEQIFDCIWGFDEEYSEGALRVYINKLKKVIGSHTIENVKKMGYKLSNG